MISSLNKLTRKLKDNLLNIERKASHKEGTDQSKVGSDQLLIQKVNVKNDE